MNSPETAPWPHSHGYYFFLSYAHSPPTSDEDRTGVDHWVRVFYRDLRTEATRLARPDSGMEVGYFDPALPLGSDRKALVASVLGATEVFVPLYSPQYLNRSWSLGERELFQRRLASASSGLSRSHIQPVLWIPLPSWDQEPEVVESLELGSDTPAYSENGLRTMCMLSQHRDQYKAIVQRLARRIVDAAERHPLGPSRSPTLLASAHPAQTDTPFVIAVLAPTGNRLPPGRHRDAYGTSSVLWRPFVEGSALPVAEYAANVVERSGLPTRIVDLEASRAMFEHCPGVLLLDPWIIAGANGRAELQSVVGRLREWVIPVVVIDQSDPQYASRGATLVADVVTLLADTSGHRVRQAHQVAEFLELMPTVATQMRRQYLRHAQGFPPKGPHAGRPRLIGHNDPASQTVGEGP